MTHSIDTGDQRPVKQSPQQTPIALRAKVEPSSSPCASAIVLVQKRDGGLRFCVDYRRINSLTKLDEFPLPCIDDTLDLLSGHHYFSTLDLASGYWQVWMDPTSKEKTAFVTYAGLYQLNKIPFGLGQCTSQLPAIDKGYTCRSCQYYIHVLCIWTIYWFSERT